MMKPRFLLFTIGFVAAWLLIARYHMVEFMAPSGNAVVGMPLWMFYESDIPEPETRMLGPASNNPTKLETAIKHVAASAFIGAIVAVVGSWIVRRVQGRAVSPDTT